MSAAPKRFLDVWIIESNTVYREVPFTVVADWVQQGRLLEDDMLRPSGTRDWMKVGATPTFAPYLPKAMPQRVEDKAEAMEPVSLDFAWKKPRDEDDEDVDMIPLIDVSLVLLIFFMMTATGAASMFINTPQTENVDVDQDPGGLWIGINFNDPKIPIPSYSLGTNNHGTIRPDMTQEQCLAELEHFLDVNQQRVDVTIQADEAVRAGEVRDLAEKLGSPPFQGRIDHQFMGVREKKP
jgi:biopolymer transport protein ExbD